MAVYLRKQKNDILREALRKLETKTPITSTNPGSVARAFTEAITTEIGDYYDALDFQVSQSVISTAAGRGLDLLGQLYGVERRTITDIAAIDRTIGAFYFYIDANHDSDIVIPAGTRIFTASDSFVGRQLSYSTTTETTIKMGTTRSFASIKPDFGDAIYTAAPGTLVVHSFTSPPGVLVKSTNPKHIAAQPGYESDDNYRIRIIKSIRVASGGTAEAVRFAALGVRGVRDVKIQENVYGLGSYRLIVTPEEQNLDVTSARQLKETLEKVRPLGVRMFLAQPTQISVDIVASVVLKKTARSIDEVLVRTVTIAIKRYLNSLLAGDTMVYNRLLQAIMDSSSDIQDVILTSYAPNGVQALRRNFTPKEEQMLVPGNIGVNITTL